MPNTLAYEQQAAVSGRNNADFLALVNSQGARGFRYLSDYTYSGDAGLVKSLFVNQAQGIYSYELLTSANSADTIIAQHNAQGVRGFDYAGDYVQGTLYRKLAGSNAVYAVARAPAVPAAGDPSTPTAFFLAQANAQGADGYRYQGAYFGGTELFNRYQKVQASSAQYVYDVQPTPATEATWLALVNSQGSRGYKFKTGLSFGADGIKLVFEKDLNQSATFVFTALNSFSTANAALAQANSEGAKGNRFLGDYSVPQTGIKTLYFTATNCSGLLCEARGPFGF